MRRRVVFAGLVGVTIAAGFLACGLDENGQSSDGGLDATSNDSPIVTDAPLDVPIDVPQACKTLDATACIGDASAPDGWTYAVITAGDQLCPTTLDYQSALFLTNPQPQGGCSCACSISGSVDCSGQLEAGSQGGTCNGGKWTVFDAGNATACIVTNWSDPHYQIPSPPTSTANLHCDASVATLPGWKSDLVTACTPKCTADFCNVGTTYKRCVLGTGTSCPDPFTVKQSPLGIEAGVVTACNGCGCTLSQTPPCSALVQPFANTNCTSPQADASVAGPCENAGGGNNVNAFSYTPIVPDAACSASTGSPAAAFASSVTVCCLP